MDHSSFYATAILKGDASLKQTGAHTHIDIHTLDIKAVMKTEIDEERREKRIERRKRVWRREKCAHQHTLMHIDSHTYSLDDDEWDDALPLRLPFLETTGRKQPCRRIEQERKIPWSHFSGRKRSHTPQTRQGATIRCTAGESG